MRIVFVSSEIKPYASTGGLADVMGALPAALSGQGTEVVRIMPMYRPILEGRFPVTDTQFRLPVPVGLRTLEAEVWQCDEPGPRTYFVRKDEFFDRRELYSLPERDYDDNFERFIFFQKAAVGIMDNLIGNVDIVHANDWQTALLPYFLQYGVQGMGRQKTERVVFTIHNMAYQGIFPDRDFPYSNLPYACFSLEELEYYGNINCMKGAILRSDRVTTVSERYAEEILHPDFGCGLEGVLQDNQFKLKGILNGVDYRDWDPRQDIQIAAPYSADNLAGKAQCKNAVLQTMGLLPPKPSNRRIPLIGMVSRLVDQKGMDLLAEAMDAIMSEDVYFVMLGSGQEAYQDLCRTWAKRWPKRFAIHIGYHNGLAHQIEAGADIYMMPSKFEPCGLNQMYSLRYGTVPIVHATGGLDDTIETIDSAQQSGNGYKFIRYEATELVAALKAALLHYQDHEGWERTQRRIMKEDFSWQRSAALYRSVYEELITESSGTS